MYIYNRDIEEIDVYTRPVVSGYITDASGNARRMVYPDEPVTYTEPFYVEDISGSDNTVTIMKYDDSAPALTIEKSTDGVNWTSMGTTSTSGITATVPANGKLYLRCSTNTWAATSYSNYNTIKCSSRFNVGGNIMSLLYGSSFTGEETAFPSGSTCTFSHLFDRVSTLVSAENLLLPATTLTYSCYMYMFDRCTSLTAAPELPATTLAEYSYAYMFWNCTSLTTAPELPATTLTNSCYMFMFDGCSSLTTAPELPATTLTFDCYSYMFCGTSLTTAPELPATTLAFSCYYAMFENCTSIVQAPVLPATMLATGCYYYMFRNCTSLNSIKCLAINISASDCTTGWTDNVSSTGTFTKAASMSSWTTGANGIPSGWTVQNA